MMSGCLTENCIPMMILLYCWRIRREKFLFLWIGSVKNKGDLPYGVQKEIFG